MAVPTVTGLDPASGPAGTLVVVTGTGFLEDCSDVTFGTYSCGLNYSVISDTQLSCVAPAGTGTVYVKVTTSGGQNSTGTQFTFATYEGGSNSAPTVTGVSPGSSANYYGQGGDTVTVTGTGFATARAVWFGATIGTAVQASFTIGSPTSITAIAPPGEAGTTVYVFVENNYGTSTDADTDNDFAYPSSSAPTVSSLSPASGFPGMNVTVTGTNYTDATAVSFGSLYADYRIDSSTSIVAVVPGDETLAGTTVDVLVANPWGISSNTAADNFTYGEVDTKLLKTVCTLSSGSLAVDPYTDWIVTAGSITITLTATYTGGPGVDSTWYRIDNGVKTKYNGAAKPTVSGNGSHKLEFWSIGKDGVIEPTNVGYINITDSLDMGSTLVGNAIYGGIVYRWSSLNVAGIRYQVYLDTNATPTTLVTTTPGLNYIHKMSVSGTAVYCRVRAVTSDGTTGGYSNTVGPLQPLQDASDLANDAITAAKLAPSLTPPPLLSSAPALPDSDYPTGSYYYNTTDEVLYVTNNGTSWTVASLTTAVLGKVVTGVIEAGAIGADELAANSIFAKNVVVADYENLVQNSNSEADETGKDTAYNSADIEYRGVYDSSTYAYAGTHSRRRIASGTGTTNRITLTRLIECKAGDKFSLSCMARMSTTEASYGCRVEIQGYRSDGSTPTTSAISSYTGTTTYAAISTTYTVPATTGTTGTVYVVANLCVNATSNYYGYFDQILFRKNLSGSLIVDGEIQGITLTGNTIRTADADKRIEIAAGAVDTLSFYTGSTAETGPAKLQVFGSTTDGSLQIFGPAITGAIQPMLIMSTENTPMSTIQLYARENILGYGAPGDSPNHEGCTTALSGAVTYGPSRRAGLAYEHDFMNATASYTAQTDIDPWTTIESASGLSASTAMSGYLAHPGTLDVYCAAAQYSGLRMRTAVNAISLTTNTTSPYDFDYAEFTFRVPYTTGTRARMGFMSSALWADPPAGETTGDYGAYININATTLLGRVTQNGTTHDTSPTYTITAGTWYTAKVKCFHDYVEFFVYSESETELWNQTVSYVVTGQGLGHGFYIWTTGTSSQNILEIDYMNMFLAPRSR